MALSCFTLFVPIQLHNHIMVWTGRRDATVMCSMGLVSPWPVSPGCCSNSLAWGQLGYAPLTILLYRSVSYSPWLASIIAWRTLSCLRRFLSTCLLVRRKRMMPEGNPMALQDSQQSRRWREWVGKQGCCATLGLHGQCPVQHYRPPGPLFHPSPPSADLSHQ